MDINRKTVRLWCERFVAQGPPGLWEVAPGRGRKATYSAEQIQAVIDATLQSKPKGMTHWSCRLMASNQGMSKSTVSNLWRSHNIKPHRSKTFQLSRDPKFLQKLTDVVGLYLNPPDQAIVLCVDEKSQIQALNRTQPGLPLKKGRCGTMTHDYKRNGTTTLFAALDLLQGKVIGDCHKRHRHQEFLKFLRRIDREFSGQTPLHLVMDNYGTHSTAEVKAWLKKHPRYVLHYVPTSCSWLNLIERWFAELTNKRIRRDSFLSVDDLTSAIEEFLSAWNENPKPFIWTATVDSILAKLARCRQTLEQIQPGCTVPKTRKRKSSEFLDTTLVSNMTHDIAMVGILVHGDNHFIVRGPLPDREAALALVRHWCLIQVGTTTALSFDRWSIVSREFRENLEWAVVVPRDAEMSPAVITLLEELSARGITIHDSQFGPW